MDSSVQTMGDVAVMQSTSPHLMGGAKSPAAVDKASKDFEGMFMSQMLQPIFQSVEVNKTFGGGHGEEVMRGFLVQEYGKLVSKGMNLGIADAVKKEMIKAQATTAGSTATNGGSNAAIQ
jgi:Rod binding domain-containing protein